MAKPKARHARREAAPAVKVALAYVHGDAGRVTSFEESMLALRDWDAKHNNVLHQRLTVRYGTDGLPAGRNTIAGQMLTSECDWLLWVDTDMGFAPDALDRLLEAADPVLRPIVGGLCFASRQYAHDGMSGYRTRPQPTLYDWREGDDGVSRFFIVPIYPVNAVMRVAATGSAFILIHRSVFESIAEKFGPTWYDRTPDPTGEILGEDISFCVRAMMADHPIHVHTGVRTTHYKSQWVQELDHWRAYNPPPATDDVAVIVPVMRRPQNAAPFMASLRASTGLATVYAIADEDDTETILAWKAAGAEVIVGTAVTFAKKANLGYAATSEPWLFLAGDDVKFHPGWLDHAQHTADVLKGDVIGTNDLGNARVMAGDHATHLLVRRSYVDQRGAGWDGPGVLAHEGYRHWYVDDEIVCAAKQRNVWQMALGSVVEHLHPLWRKGEDDEVYALGQSSSAVDEVTFRTRLAANS